jgi:preprotein translocase subunit SecA
MTEALDYYEEHAEAMPGGADTARQIERDLMLQIIDQRWRDHLAEMDYLREGINLRAMGQQDPLVAWQREGFTMFGQLMDHIDDDYMRYVMHVEAISQPEPEFDMSRAVYEAAEDPVVGTGLLTAALAADRGTRIDQVGGAQPVAPAANGSGQAAQPLRPRQVSADPEALVPVVKGAEQKVGRNDPCWCGSGKKFKLCHGSP